MEIVAICTSADGLSLFVERLLLQSPHNEEQVEHFFATVEIKNVTQQKPEDAAMRRQYVFFVVASSTEMYYVLVVHIVVISFRRTFRDFMEQVNCDHLQRYQNNPCEFPTNLDLKHVIETDIILLWKLLWKQIFEILK